MRLWPVIGWVTVWWPVVGQLYVLRAAVIGQLQVLMAVIGHLGSECVVIGLLVAVISVIAALLLVEKEHQCVAEDCLSQTSSDQTHMDDTWKVELRNINKCDYLLYIQENKNRGPYR